MPCVAFRRTSVPARRGAMLVLSALILFLVLTLGLALIALTGSGLIRVGHEERHARVFHLAEAGIDFGLEQLRQDTLQSGLLTARTYNTTAALVALGVADDAVGGVRVTPVAGSAHLAWLDSEATAGGVAKTIRVLVTVRRIGIWDNAIFAGVGQAGRGINGNVDIRGSVHILGDGESYTDLNGNGQRDGAEPFTDLNGNGTWDPGEPFTDVNGDGIWNPAEPYVDTNGNGLYDPPLTATEMASDLSGTALIGNNYAGMPADLRAQVPPIPLMPNSSGTLVESLSAELRVKHGRVDISGNARVGQPTGTHIGMKNQLDGVYVSDGFGGNQGASGVFSDNGHRNRYDLGNLVTFPHITGVPHSDGGVSYASYLAYLQARGLPSPVSSITDSTPTFSASDAQGNSISWNQSTRTLSVTGIVYAAGNLTIGTSKSTIRYTGRGTLVAAQDISVHSDLLPAAGQTFPTTAGLGLIAGRDMGLATGTGDAQLKMMGAFFAQRRITSAKQNEIAGTFVSNHFDMGTNVPNIYQVPLLSSFLPPGMPGGTPQVVIREQNWREL